MGQMDVLSRGEVKRKKSGMQHFGEALGAGMNTLQQYNQMKQGQQDQQKMSEALKGEGINPNLSPEMQKLSFQAKQAQELQKQKYSFESQDLQRKENAQSQKLQREQDEKLQPLQAGLDTIKDMRGIGKKGNIGIGTSVRGIWNEDTRRQAGEYERLGKSLISLSSNIPIRNKAEFETLAHDLYDASISDAKREGILNAMEKIIRRSMGMNEVETQNNQQRPPLSSFGR